MEPPEPSPRVVRFGVFELDRRSGELRKDGVRIRLQEQPLRVLDALLAAPGEPVTREELRQRLWAGDTFVDFDNGLNRAINRLRTALGDEADNPRFIETLERRGYRFIAPVAGAPPETPRAGAAPVAPAPKPPGGDRTPTEPPVPSGPARRSRTWVAAGSAVAVLAALGIVAAAALRRDAGHVPIRSLAVLPLANLTGDPAQDYFSDGMTEALITQLASLPGLRVTSRQSVMRYKGSVRPLPEIARELGVEGVVEGSVVRASGRVRITAQLIHAPTDRHLWARSYDRAREDVLALQADVSAAIATEIRLALGAAESRRLAARRPVNPEAYDAYLLGRHFWNQRTQPAFDKALEYFRAAVARDPDFALAHAGLALVYGPRLIFGYVPPGQGLAEQKTAALKALELDPGLGEARAALAVVHMQEWDWEGAEAEFRRAVESDPSCTVAHLWYGWYLNGMRRGEESLAHRRRALELDPLDPSVNRGVARDLADVGRYDEALAQWGRAIELEPDRAASYLSVAVLHLDRGRPAEAASYLDKARALGPSDPWVVAYLGVVAAASGHRPEAIQVLARLTAESKRRYVSPVLPAYVHVALGQMDAAFPLLERAYAAKDPLLIPIQATDAAGGFQLPGERVAALRSDPRFGLLVRRMGFERRTVAR